MTVPKSEGMRRRRNATPASKVDRRLPTTGRTGVAPAPPVPLGEAGLRWWNWAWSTPQATQWTHDGFNEPLAKRAQLEDVWTAVGNKWIEGDLTKIMPLMARLDECFGFTPKSAANLHMTFHEPEPELADADRSVTDIRDRLKGLGS